MTEIARKSAQTGVQLSHHDCVHDARYTHPHKATSSPRIRLKRPEIFPPGPRTDAPGGFNRPARRPTGRYGDVARKLRGDCFSCHFQRKNGKGPAPPSHPCRDRQIRLPPCATRRTVRKHHPDQETTSRVCEGPAIRPWAPGPRIPLCSKTVCEAIKHGPGGVDIRLGADGDPPDGPPRQHHRPFWTDEAQLEPRCRPVCRCSPPHPGFGVG